MALAQVEGHAAGAQAGAGEPVGDRLAAVTPDPEGAVDEDPVAGEQAGRARRVRRYDLGAERSATLDEPLGEVALKPPTRVNVVVRRAPVTSSMRS